MALQYKIDILAALKEKGITTYKIRQEKILSESTVQKLRASKGVSWENLETLCRLLDCQPGDLMEYIKDPAVQETP
jgi:putative transcriptional regulator